MNCFPQLSTGATGQFPIRKRRITRTVVNEAPDGRRVKWSDSGVASVEWELEFQGISDEERNTLEQFFRDMEGRLGSFTLLDPTDNLLEWSEDLTKPAWEKAPLITVAAGIGDPLGTTRASRLTNGGGAAGQVQQTINAPAGYQYALSLWARSLTGGTIRLFRGGNAVREYTTHQLTGSWNRLVSSGKLTSPEENTRFGLEIGPGSAVEVFGLQAEAQPWASGYRKTLSGAGVYSHARFQQDWLEFSATGPGEHSGRVKVKARED